MLFLRAAVAGPGPATLAYRLRHRLRPNPICPSEDQRHTSRHSSPRWMQRTRSFHSTASARDDICLEFQRNDDLPLPPSTSTSIPPRREVSPRPLSSRLSGLRTKARRTPTSSEEASAANSLSSTRQRTPVASMESPMEIILLPAPPELRDYAPHLELLLQSCRSQDLFKAVSTWTHLDDCQSTDQAGPEHFEAISAFLAELFIITRKRDSIDAIARHNPTMYGRLIHMATEAAARDHWQGLYRIMLALLASGRPSGASQAFERYKSATWRVTGKNKVDLLSWDRGKRLAARLEGEGIKHLTHVQIAALTLTEQFDSTNILSMFDASSDLRRIHGATLADLRNALRSAHAPDNAMEHILANQSRFVLAMLVYHPSAFLNRISAATMAHNLYELLWLYNLLLSASIGPGRILRARDLKETGFKFTASSNEISIVPEVWRMCLWRTLYALLI